MTSPSPSPPSTPPPTTATATTRASNQNQKSIPNPRRLLILTPTSHSLTTIPPLLHTLTGVSVDNPPTAEAATTPTATETETTPTTTFAGYTTHPLLHIENKYYTADIPIWVDEIPLSAAPTPTPTPETKENAGTTQWKTEFSGPEARVVRDAIGGVMVCIRNPQPPAPGAGGDKNEDITERNDVKSIKDFLRCIGDVKRLVEEERGDIGFGEVLGVIVLVEGPSSSSSGSKSASSADRKRVDDDDELDTGPAEEEPFSIPWWEDQLDEIGLMDFDVVKWDSGVEEDDKRDKYGGASLSLSLSLSLYTWL